MPKSLKDKSEVLRDIELKIEERYLLSRDLASVKAASRLSPGAGKWLFLRVKYAKIQKKIKKLLKEERKLRRKYSTL